MLNGSSVRYPPAFWNQTDRVETKLNWTEATVSPSTTEAEKETLGKGCFLETHCFNLPHLRERHCSAPGSSCRVVDFCILASVLLYSVYLIYIAVYLIHIALYLIL